MLSPDTIVAIGTPPGVGALAVVRVSGAESLELVSRLCPGLAGIPEPRRATLATVQDPRTGEDLDQVLLTVFRGPESYTGEDMVEISCHGGWLSSRLVLEACLGLGLRLAEPGEFTKRAYLLGKMDLVQAEAVLDLVEGRSRALHRAALHQLERRLSERVAALRAALVRLEASLVHYLDFPEEDDPPVSRAELAGRAGAIEAEMLEILATAGEGELLREGALTVLAGRPNVGKSSLFNALLGTERAIVTEVPGTTRDALEAVVSIEGFPFRLVDTAGLRSGTEKVERMGIEVAKRYLRGADVVLYCVEGERAVGAEERRFLDELEGTPVLLVRTKMDGKGIGKPERASAVGRRECAPGGGGLRVEAEVRTSVETGEGLGELRERLAGLVFGGLVGMQADAPVVTRRRQAEALQRAVTEVRGFREAIEGGLAVEVAAAHLKPAETELEELLGVIPREEVLERLFSDFCIGK